MEDKRLTNKNLDEYNPEIDFCSDCKYYGEPNGCNRPDGTCANYDRFLETYNCLNEFKDKIENGTLIEFPRICERKEHVYPYRLEYLDDSGDVRGIVCTTKREAEERLKRLQIKD